MAFTEIDLDSWPRREHFHLFRVLEVPYFSVTVEVDVTDWQRAIKAARLPFYPTMIHQVVAAANAVEAFRLRVRGERVVLHDRVHPSFTVPWRGELFNFCRVEFEPDLAGFLARCLPAMAASEAADALVLDPSGRDDMLFISCLPWFSFTAMSQVDDARAGDTFPKIAWGKVMNRGERALMPLQVQLHHALADGLHIARFLEHLEAGLAAQAQALISPERSQANTL